MQVQITGSFSWPKGGGWRNRGLGAEEGGRVLAAGKHELRAFAFADRWAAHPLLLPPWEPPAGAVGLQRHSHVASMSCANKHSKDNKDGRDDEPQA